MNKPPIGIMPRWLWLENRQNDLADTIQRYEDAGIGDRSCVAEWKYEILRIKSELLTIKSESVKS